MPVAQGIVVPHVDTAEVAARIVSNCKYPPVGHRSVTGALPQLDFKPAPLGEATAAINAATLLILMLETPEAIDNVEAIAAVPGFDVLLVGTNDLCMEMGIPGQLDHRRVGEAFERIVAACRAHGKYAGLGGVYDPALMRRRQGARRRGARDESRLTGGGESRRAPHTPYGVRAQPAHLRQRATGVTLRPAATPARRGDRAGLRARRISSAQAARTPRPPASG
jgi:hypothetical protein